MPPGSLNALIFAFQLVLLPLGVFSIAISAAIFPTLSRYASLGRRKWRSLWRNLDELVAVAKVEQPKSNDMIGAELGYRYEGSPLIVDEPGGPEHPLRQYVPTTWPGTRLPPCASAGCSAPNGALHGRRPRPCWKARR